ncbi:hypothetical protein GCM10007301_29960 [Azorhizobium oxalatiphilum]|uniref:Uncharacterized protein n=1 Tax=Azorhizobium oxalatiphilum TaxID=980631 RepID=A0A917C248_9HYPH|nr:hypothetical protein [Azorhizobium oxalatiphilum]GGF68293.1 hypothetical protein GCM10007301_29960 [Azorhizobium oxalatiphilum]
MTGAQKGAVAVLAAAALWTGASIAQPITAKPADATKASFDIVETTIVTRGGNAVFTTRVRGEAGKDKPDATGRFAGSSVYAYVWPTSLDSGDIGFEKGQGIVALAVTFHPDFDDAAHGGKNRHIWHPHWVVLAQDKACGGGLKVIDIPKGTKPKVPPTWPDVPLLIDSPEYPTTFTGETVEVSIPLAQISGIAGASFDGVTAGLKVNGNLHAPLLCVDNVFKVASGNLSLPGKVTPAN